MPRVAAPLVSHPAALPLVPAPVVSTEASIVQMTLAEHGIAVSIVVGNAEPVHTAASRSLPLSEPVWTRMILLEFGSAERSRSSLCSAKVVFVVTEPQVPAAPAP